MKLIVGLGNPEKKYENTRHNVGFWIIDNFLKKHNLKLNNKKFSGIFYKDEKIIIAKPLTYMNLSGVFIKKIQNFFKISLKDILIIYDECSLKIGKAKIKTSGNSGGQKGIENIITELKSNNFARLKIGIGLPVNKNFTNYVLSSFTKKESQTINEINSQIIESIELFINDDLNKSMQKLNSI